MKCPGCDANGQYEATDDGTPGTVTEFYRCPDPDCGVVSYRVTRDV